MSDEIKALYKRMFTNPDETMELVRSWIADPSKHDLDFTEDKLGLHCVIAALSLMREKAITRNKAKSSQQLANLISDLSDMINLLFNTQKIMTAENTHLLETRKMLFREQQKNRTLTMENEDLKDKLEGKIKEF